MKPQLLMDVIKKHGFDVKNVEFYEEGYEVQIGLGGEKSFPKEAQQTVEKQTGLVFAEIEYIGNNARIKFVPASFEEMVDYVWSYIETFCDSRTSIQCKLMDACSALERLVEEIPKDCKQKTLAINNYKNFTKLIF